MSNIDGEKFDAEMDPNNESPHPGTLSGVFSA